MAEPIEMLNQSRYHLGCGLGWAKEPLLDDGPDPSV